MLGQGAARLLLLGLAASCAPVISEEISREPIWQYVLAPGQHIVNYRVVLLRDSQMSEDSRLLWVESAVSSNGLVCGHSVHFGGPQTAVQVIYRQDEPTGGGHQAAFGNALDAWLTEDGGLIAVVGDWSASGGRGQVLRIQDGAGDVLCEGDQVGVAFGCSVTHISIEGDSRAVIIGAAARSVPVALSTGSRVIRVDLNSGIQHWEFSSNSVWGARCMSSIDDVNNDGSEDIAISGGWAATPVSVMLSAEPVVVLSGRDGSEVWRSDPQFDCRSVGLVGRIDRTRDLDGDGIGEVLCEYPRLDLSDREICASVMVLSGRDGEVLWASDANAQEPLQCEIVLGIMRRPEGVVLVRGNYIERGAMAMVVGEVPIASDVTIANECRLDGRSVQWYRGGLLECEGERLARLFTVGITHEGNDIIEVW